MNKVIENADLDWPEGATHYVDDIVDIFVKWVDGVEFEFADGKWTVSDYPYSLDDYLENDWIIYSRPSRQSALLKVMAENGPLLDAHAAMLKALEGFKKYTDPKPYFRRADGLLTIMQKDCGQNAIESAKALQEAIGELEEYIDVQSGRVAHG